MPIFPWPVCPLAGHARLGQHVVAGSMMSLLEWLCWRAYQEGVCLNPHFHCKRTSPRFSGELPDVYGDIITKGMYIPAWHDVFWYNSTIIASVGAGSRTSLWCTTSRVSRTFRRHTVRSTGGA